MLTSLILFCLYSTSILLTAADSIISNSNDHVDPTEYFTGSQYRPKLEIVRPENGQVLSDGILDIEITISGYELPSHFDESSTCIALSKDKGVIVVEHCFDQSPELIFHVNGLTPGEAYTLRVLFLERGKVIALSVRSFKVGGVIGVLADDENRPVSIQTALQVALRHQVNGMHVQAEQIYQRILSESPSNADALNHLGVNFYQQGDHMTAIAYMQQALVSNHSILADSYYNLGEVYRVIGQIDKAKEHFEISLSMNPNLTSAMYKLGVMRAMLQHRHTPCLIYQQNLRQFEMAKALYRRLLKLELSREPEARGGGLSQEELHECKVRECDLLSIIKKEEDDDSSDSYEILNCWKEGIALFPSSGLLFNELGNNYLQRGMHEAAFQSYSSAVKLGFFVAFVNRASVLEIQGYVADARLSFQESVAEAMRNHLPHFHVRLRLATVLPRILPSSDSELQEQRQAVERQLDELLAATPPLNIENAAPINYGFSTGYYLAFHGLSNLVLKQKMYRSYILFCPALSYGHFASSADTTERFAVKSRDRFYHGGGGNPVSDEPAPLVPGGDVYAPARRLANDMRASGVGAVRVEIAEEAEKSEPTSFSYWGEEHLGEWEAFLVSTMPAAPPSSMSVAHESRSRSLTGFPPFPTEQEMLSTGSFSLLPSFGASSPRGREGARRRGDDGDRTGGQVLRVGFVSRFFYSHPVGFLFEEIIRILSDQSHDPSDSVSGLVAQTEVFMLEARSTADPVSRNIQLHANSVHKVAPDLNQLVDAIRSAKLDILVYADLGLDPITYFASFSRLAPIQVTGLGHPDTSGVSTVDYFVSDEVELPPSPAGAGAASLYSESLVLMAGMGTCFVDRTRDQAIALQSPRTALLDRAKYIEKVLGIPRSAHLYVIVQPLYTLHPIFDECIARILMQDKLGYLVVLNPGNTWHSSHHNLFFNRLGGRLSEDALKRILTFQYLQTTEFIQKSISVAHVLLDPFPGGSYHSSLLALSIGIPVITFPTQHMLGRQCLSLYTRMGYLDLVVSSSLEYATLALTLAHKPKIRQNHVNFLMKHRSKLFDCSNVKKDWMHFFSIALARSSDPRLRNMTLMPSPEG